MMGTVALVVAILVLPVFLTTFLIKILNKPIFDGALYSKNSFRSSHWFFIKEEIKRNREMTEEGWENLFEEEYDKYKSENKILVSKACIVTSMVPVVGVFVVAALLVSVVLSSIFLILPNNLRKWNLTWGRLNQLVDKIVDKTL